MDHQVMDSERETYGNNQLFLPRGATSTMQSILFALLQVQEEKGLRAIRRIYPGTTEINWYQSSTYAYQALCFTSITTPVRQNQLSMPCAGQPGRTKGLPYIQGVPAVQFSLVPKAN